MNRESQPKELRRRKRNNQCYAIYYKPSEPKKISHDQFQPFVEKKYENFSKPMNRPVRPIPPHYFNLN